VQVVHGIHTWGVSLGARATDEAFERSILVAEALQLLINLRISASVNGWTLFEGFPGEGVMDAVGPQAKKSKAMCHCKNGSEGKDIRRSTRMLPGQQAQYYHCERNPE